MNISALGEFELIARLTADLTLRADIDLGVGDDCAILDLGNDQLLLATCDSQVEGIHFTLRTSTPEQIGRKALAINLSDIAAMGGVPRYALVSLIMPPRLSVAILQAQVNLINSLSTSHSWVLLSVDMLYDVVEHG